MQVTLSSLQITDLTNDTYTDVNGASGTWTLQQLLLAFPQTFYIAKNSLGEDRLCAARIDGAPFTVKSVNLGTPYTPTVADYDVLFPGQFSTHPIKRPK